MASSLMTTRISLFLVDYRHRYESWRVSTGILIKKSPHWLLLNELGTLYFQGVWRWWPRKSQTKTSNHTHNIKWAFCNIYILQPPCRPFLNHANMLLFSKTVSLLLLHPHPRSLTALPWKVSFGKMKVVQLGVLNFSIMDLVGFFIPGWPWRTYIPWWKMGLALFLQKWWRHSNLRHCLLVDELFEKQKVDCRGRNLFIAIVTYAKLVR